MSFIPGGGGGGGGNYGSVGVAAVIGGNNIDVNDDNAYLPVVNAVGVVLTVDASGAGIIVDNTDSTNPKVSNNGVLSVSAGTGITVDNTDPQNPVVAYGGAGAVASVNAGTNIVVSGTSVDPIVGIIAEPVFFNIFSPTLNNFYPVYLVPSNTYNSFPSPMNGTNFSNAPAPGSANCQDPAFRIFTVDMTDLRLLTSFCITVSATGYQNDQASSSNCCLAYYFSNEFDITSYQFSPSVYLAPTTSVYSGTICGTSRLFNGADYNTLSEFLYIALASGPGNQGRFYNFSAYMSVF